MNGVVVWLTGLPASGKTTLARRIGGSLRERGVASCLLDSDAVRGALVHSKRPLGYDEADRRAFYETLARLAALLASQGLCVLVAATAHRRLYRAIARQLAPRFFEVHVATPLSDCERRDPKGLYRAARADEASRLPGVGARYEPPVSPDAVAQGGEDSAAMGQIVELVARLG
jgi:adenylylsulfate kinase